MNRKHRLWSIVLAITVVVPITAAPVCGNETRAPFRVASDLFDAGQPDTLGLAMAPGIETHTIFRPDEGDSAYNHGAVLIPFKGSLYAQWQSSEKDEDSLDTHVLWSVSRDGREWSSPQRLLDAAIAGAHSNGGWWTDGETLVAYVVRWRDPEKGVRSGITDYILSRDGKTWTTPAPVSDLNDNPVDGVIEQDPHQLPGGRVVTAFHTQPGLILAPWYTDDPLGIAGWTRGQMQNLPYEGDSSRELEPSWFIRSDGAMVMVMRDQASSFRKLASVSHDRGMHWTTPVVTDMPDSRSKQSAGNLPDGTAYLAGNPTNDKRRFPLVLTLSADGFYFNRAYLLRAGGEALPRMRREGRYKRAGFSYPKSTIWNGHLYVAYATNKEDIELSRVPLDMLKRWTP